VLYIKTVMSQHDERKEKNDMKEFSYRHTPDMPEQCSVSFVSTGSKGGDAENNRGLTPIYYLLFITTDVYAVFFYS
jgi:hypothetical protein